MSEVATETICLGDTSIIWTSVPGTAEISVVAPKKIERLAALAEGAVHDPRLVIHRLDRGRLDLQDAVVLLDGPLEEGPGLGGVALALGHGQEQVAEVQVGDGRVGPQGGRGRVAGGAVGVQGQIDEQLPGAGL